MTSDLEKFGTAVNDAAELFATAPSTAGEKKVALSKQSLLVVQSILDGHLSSESTTLPLYMTMLQHITSSRPTTRSAAKRKSHSDQVKPTPLSQFYIPEEEQESDNELVWQQMQMRLDTLQAVLSNLLGRQDFGVDTEQQLEDSSASEPEDQEEDEITDEESSESDLDEAESTLPLNHSAFLSSPSAQNSATSPSKTTRANKRKAKSSPVDDTFFHLDDFLRQSEAGEAQMARSLQQSNRTDQDSDEDDDDDDVDLFAEVEMDNEDDNDLNGGDTEDLQDIQDAHYDDFFAPPPSDPHPHTSPQKHKQPSPRPTPTRTRVRFNETVRVKPIRPRKNKQLLSEAGVGGSLFQRLVAGGPITEQDVQELERLGVDPTELLEEEGDDDDDDEEEEEEEKEEDDDEENDGEFDGIDDDEMDEDKEEEDGEETMLRLNNDLFGDDDADGDHNMMDSDAPSDDDEDPTELSRHERRQRALSSQIAALEAENVGKKDWVLSGEARARDRPINSLLEQDLEFEHTGKATPTITPESVASLEDRIKQRILDLNWDDVERKLPMDPNTLAPTKLMDVSAEQGGKSLSQMFEQQYAQSQGQSQDVDEPTKKKHQEIADLFDGICSKLDALSNARYTPKAPQTQIQSTSNVSAVSMEDATPTTTSSSTLLAPEEVYAHQGDPTKSASKAEMTSSEKKSVRRQNRRSRSNQQKHVAELIGQRRGADKDQARNELIGTKGVTVLGKPSQKKQGNKKEKAKLAKKAQLAERNQSGQALKL